MSLHVARKELVIDAMMSGRTMNLCVRACVCVCARARVLVCVCVLTTIRLWCVCVHKRLHMRARVPACLHVLCASCSGACMERTSGVEGL